MTDFDEFRSRLLEVDALNSAASLCRWDQMTYMPVGGNTARARQLATLGRIAHERFVDPSMGHLLERLERATAQLPPESDDASLVRVTKRLYERALRVPATLVADLDEQATKTYQSWMVARSENNFETVRPMLERLVELSRRRAECQPGYASIADPLIALDDDGMTAASLRELFRGLRAELVPLVRAIASRPLMAAGFLQQAVPLENQLGFARRVVEAFGYNFQHGRLDLTPHPFTTRIALRDVRITTRMGPTNFMEALFIALHEAGHALYEQGGREELEGTPLAGPASAGVDESQARLWENLVGRSLEFWQHFYPELQRAFGAPLETVDLHTFYSAINRVTRSLIRGQADEVTYNLHVMLRFNLELDLLEGRLDTKELARAWRERFEADFGIEVPDDRLGVLQDVHWFSGRIGGVFQGYTLGNVMSAQLYAAAVAKHPRIPAQIATGEFGTLRTWLRHNVYEHGAKFTANELIQRATGHELSIQPYVDYLWRKYQPLYGLERRELAQ